MAQNNPKSLKITKNVGYILGVICFVLGVFTMFFSVGFGILFLILGIILIFAVGKASAKKLKALTDGTAPEPPKKTAAEAASPSESAAASAPRARAAQAPKRERGWSSKYKYIYYDVPVFMPEDIAVDFSQIKFDAATLLKQEKENAFDENAVKVTHNGMDIGYLNKGGLQDMANDYLNRGGAVDVQLTSYSEDNRTAKVTLMFARAASDDSIKVFKLTGNTSEEMQEDIETCGEFEPVSVDYDYDKEKYAASSGSEIGYFPKSANSFFEENDGNIEAVIDAIEEENDKYAVYVAVKKK